MGCSVYALDVHLAFRCAGTLGLVLFGATSPLLAQSPEYSEGRVAIDGADYPYLLLAPAKLEADQSYPLILFLHGAGERGDDNAAQKRHFPERMAKLQEQGGSACFVLAPQCPSNAAWTPRNRNASAVGHAIAPQTASMRAVIAALEEVVRTQPIDRDRIALTGLSMGGFGSWDLAARHPDWFSAVVPVCGGGEPQHAARYAGLPIQVWHGDADASVPVEASRRMVNALRELKLPVQYTELPDVGHDSWNQAYTDEACLRLLLTTRRDPAAMQTATARLLADAIAPQERIAFLGDSITQGGNSPGGYLDQIRTVLKEARPEAVVIPAGISGHKVPDLLARYRKDVVDQKATLVFIYIGINDVWHSQNGKGTPIEEFEAGLRTMIRDFRAAGAEVVLATPSTIGEKLRGLNPLDTMLEDYSAVSRRVAAEEGAVLCDLRNAFFDHLRVFNPRDLDKGVLTGDGVHLNAAGNSFVAIEAARALREAVLIRAGRITSAMELK